ncbi:hypothetical protein ACQP10_08505 [Streptosporangium sandarakinum]|uniref:hypothetical protein n=1 Tax=Streptosporangium sandarakinum TaxID=1260955 RepID=UPI003D8E0731
MTTHHEAQEQRAADLFGLRPSRARICPRVVAGKHCQADHDTCVCQRHHRLLDHGRLWLDPEGHHVLTGEPYSADGDALTALLTDTASLGLTVSITGRSLWNPGQTVLIRITADRPSE